MKLKIHKSYRDVVAVCDSELIGEKFEEGKFQIEINANFFEGEEIEEEKLIETMKKLEKEDATFNIVGEKSIQAALKAGIINHDGIKRIRGVPVALVLL